MAALVAGASVHSGHPLLAAVTVGLVENGLRQLSSLFQPRGRPASWNRTRFPLIFRSWRTIALATLVCAVRGMRPPNVSANDFDRLFDDAMAALRPLAGQPHPNADSDSGTGPTTTDGSAEPAAPTEPVRGIGEALDGYARVAGVPAESVVQMRRYLQPITDVQDRLDRD